MSLRPAALAALCLSLLLPAWPAEAKGGGTIKGTVKYLGKPPAPRPIDRSSDKECARTTANHEDVVVSGGKLADVHVRLQSGTAGKHQAPAVPVVIEQQRCMYRPRVIGAMVGQTVMVKNSDPTMHNVHAYLDQASAFNRSQPKGARPIEHKPTGAAGQVFTLRCDVHAWMRAFVPLTDHPFFAVTGADGGFTLTEVPPGTYTIEAYHPKLGLKKKQVTVAAGHEAGIDFVFP